jgi:hypothetical protein
MVNKLLAFEEFYIDLLGVTISHFADISDPLADHFR